MFYLVHTSVLHIGITVFLIFSWLLFKNLGLELRGGLDLKGGSVYCRRREKRRPGPLNKGQSEAVSCALGRPHLVPEAIPGASHSFLPGAQYPIVPLPAWSPRKGKAAGASGWSLDFTIPRLCGLAVPVPLWASLSLSIKWACSHPSPTSNLPTPFSGPPLGIHPSQLVWLSISEWAHDPNSANQILPWENQQLMGS